MNYLKLYIKICRLGELRGGLPKSSREIHHIFPVSIFGKNNRTVHLYIREHYVAHVLLMKACWVRYGTQHPYSRKMAMAVHKMTVRLAKNGTIAMNSRQYEFARMAVRIAKTNATRPDMKGARFFGASEENIRNGIEKMRESKTGVNINYPKNRKKRPQLQATNALISEQRRKTNTKYMQMSETLFATWISGQKLFMADGRRNGNVVRAITARTEPIEKYYKK